MDTTYPVISNCKTSFNDVQFTMELVLQSALTLSQIVPKFFWLAVCCRYIGDCVEKRIKKTWPIKESTKLGFIIGVS